MSKVCDCPLYEQERVEADLQMSLCGDKHEWSLTIDISTACRIA